MIRLLLCFVALSCLFTFPGCDSPPPTTAAIRPIRAMKVGDESAVAGKSLPGRASAVNEVNLSFRVSGPLVQMPADIGDEVKKGALLAQIDATDFRVSLDDAQAKLDRAKQDLESLRIARPEDIRMAQEQLYAAEAELVNSKAEHARNIELIKTRAISKSEFDQGQSTYRIAVSRVKSSKENLAKAKRGERAEVVAAKEAEIRSLRASVENAENQLKYTSLTAPFDGTIATTFVENFQTVRPNQLILRLVDPSAIEMTIYIPESGISLAPHVKDVTCTFDAFPDKSFSAEIVEVGTEASRTTRTYPLTLRIEQQYEEEGIKILPGMAGRATGRVELPEGGLEKGFEIPETAIFADGDTKHVWVIDESSKKVRRKQVHPGELTPYGVKVPGLEPGQWIATAGVHYLSEGQEVRILGATATEASE